IFSVVFVHPGSFNKRIQEIVVVIFSETFPPMKVVVQFDEFWMFTNRLKCFPVDLPSVERIEITGAVIQKDFSVVIKKERGIPGTCLERIHGFLPLIPFRVRTHPERKIMGIGGTDQQEGISQDQCRRSAKIIIYMMPGFQKGTMNEM